MDETMLHARFLVSQEDIENDDGDFLFTLQPNESSPDADKSQIDDSMQVSIKIRPYLDCSLDYLAKFFEICVFTAGTQEYADACLDYLDPDKRIINHRLYRSHCVNPAYGVYVKDLRIIQDRNLEDILIVDNSLISFAY